MVLSSFIAITMMAQENCKVLVPTLQGQYTGKCKKGLAHGKGVAVGLERFEGQFSQGLPNGTGIWTYTNGSFFTGQFKNGKREGKGVLTLPPTDTDSLLTGYWHNDTYVGATVFRPYIITRNYSIERFNINHLNKTGSILDIKLYFNGARNENVENLQLWGDSGFEMTGFNRIGFEQITFPFKGKISYKTWNSIHFFYFFFLLFFKI